MESATTGRRERKRNATRVALVEAALALFEEKGFAATTVDEIAERADVAQRTFFRHFPTKEAVLFPNREDEISEFRRALALRPTGEPLLSSVLAAFAAGMSESTDDDHTLTVRRQRILEQAGEAGESITWGSLLTGHQIIEEVVAQHASLPVTDQTVQMVASVSLLLMAQVMPEWYAGGGTADLAALLGGQLELLRSLVELSTIPD